MRRSLTFSFDFVLFGATFLLIMVGVLFIYSSGVNSSGIAVSREYIKQLIWAATGIGILLLFPSSTTELFGCCPSTSTQFRWFSSS